MSRHRVAVTGLGTVSPAGMRAGDFFDRLLAGESFIGLHTIDEPPRPITQPAVHQLHVLFERALHVFHDAGAFSLNLIRTNLSTDVPQGQHANLERFESVLVALKALRIFRELADYIAVFDD